jgi:glycosyltransferase involved in cell wall biosynthesis
MRWYTCTPYPFAGGEDFFARDSGLLSRGFAGIGVESRAVMPGGPNEDDAGDLIRVPYVELENPDWWRSQQLDGVVLYAWGSPGYRKVAAAIRAAGIFLVLNQDSGGLVSPLCGFREWLSELKMVSGAGRIRGGLWRFLVETLKGCSYGLLFTDPLRAVHLRCGDVVAAVSPRALDRYKKLCRIYGGSALANRVALVPHPVNPIFRTGVARKKRLIVAVGRWDDERQKRAGLLMEVARRLLDADPETGFIVVGTATPSLVTWHRQLPARLQARVKMTGQVTPAELATIFQGAQIGYSPSAFESFHIASGEALCSGCSVVAARLPCMAACEWFCSENSGTLAESDSTDGHVAALRSELAAWAMGARDGEEISRVWRSRLLAPEVAKQILRLAKTTIPRESEK